MSKSPVLTGELSLEGHMQAAGSLIAQSYYLCADHLETWRPRELGPRTKSPPAETYMTGRDEFVEQEV